MKVALVQSIPVQGDTSASLAGLDRLIGNGSGADVYVLPEMFASGQFPDPSDIAETMDGPSVCWLRAKSRELDAAVAGSVAITENGRFANRLCFAMPDGSMATYDKRHLFSYSGENLHFSAGNERVTVTFRGVRFLLQVCYDLRFPVFSRNRDDYDAAIYVAAWPDRRSFAWDTLLRARAIENQAYVIGVNMTGQDQYGSYKGHSALIGPYGDTLAASPDNVESVTTGIMDMDMLTRFRTKFPALTDADLWEWLPDNGSEKL